MSKVLLIVVVLLLLGAGGFFVLSNRSKAPADTSLTNNTQMQAETTGGQKSLKDLFGLGTAQECTFKDETGNGGTVYVGNNKMRGNFATVSPQGTVSSHIIVDGQTTYLWMDGQNTGYKMTLDTTAAAETGNQAGQSMNFDQKLNYDCKGWTVNSSLFVLPTGVTFTDYNSMMVPSGENKCAACDSVPASAQAQCKAALGCN